MNGARRGTEAGGGSGTVGKAFEIIRAVVGGPDHSSTVAEIAAQLDLPRPTANRVISNLIKLGLLKRDGGSTRIIEGGRLVELAASVIEGSVQRGPRHEVLRQLVIDTRETANVGMLAGGQVRYLDRVEAAWPLALRLDVGSRVPIYCSAIGKLLLSRMAPAQQEKYLATLTLKRLTANTICDRDALRRELEQIREEGVAVDNEECFDGVIGMAVPVSPARGVPPIGLALVAPSARQTVERLRGLLPSVRDAADRLGRCFER